MKHGAWTKRRWADWNALFAHDGWYWLPASSDHTDPLMQASHLYDDAVLRAVRIARLQSPQAHSQQPPGRCHHLLQASEGAGAGRRHQPVRRCARPSFTPNCVPGAPPACPAWPGTGCVCTTGALRIALKRVDLLHAAEPLPAVEFYV
jgi:hypothetical protein